MTDKRQKARIKSLIDFLLEAEGALGNSTEWYSDLLTKKQVELINKMTEYVEILHNELSERIK